MLPMINELRYIRRLLEEAVDRKRYWWEPHGILLPQSSWNEGGKQVLGEEADEDLAARDAYERAEDAFNTAHDLNLVVVRRAAAEEVLHEHMMRGTDRSPTVKSAEDQLTERLRKTDDALSALSGLIGDKAT